MSRLVLLFSFLLSFSVFGQFKNGDIILSSSKGGLQATAITAATGSKWTHTAVIYIKDGKPMILEAVQPVQAVSLKDYLNRYGEKGVHQVMRLKDRTKLDAKAQQNANVWANKNLGKNYDGRFQWGDDKLYCSELVWKVFDQAAGIKLCAPKKMKEYNLKHPVVQFLIKRRYGSVKKINLEEKVVAPSDIADSALLEKVEVDLAEQMK